MGPDDVTASWLSDVLDTDIVDVTRQRIGDGLVGLNLRVSVEPADHNSTAPSSVVIKMPSLDPTSRATGVALRNYEREVKFYEHIASTVDVRVPCCWHGEWDEATGDFVLVLEDMAPAEPGDQIAGCDPATAELAVVELAKLHGPCWDDPTLAEHEFLSRRTGPEDAEQLSALWQMFFPSFMAIYSPYLSDASQRLVTAFGDRLVDWIDGREGPLAITHGDYRLDNLLFGSATNVPPVTVVDWQTPGHGPPVADLSYFCGAGLVPETRRQVEHDLVDRYGASLSAYDVDLERDWLWEQYRREAFAGVVMAVIASQVVGGSDRSESMFAAMATRHLQHAIDLDSIDLIA